MDYVVLTDEQDNELGVMEKLRAHEEGRLHRAVSVFIFNSKDELLLQRRALTKYHSGGLWTNTCCGHPWQGETYQDAAKRRLAEEMGLHCELKYLLNFTYSAKLDNALTECEIDHAYIGYSDAIPVIDKREAAGYEYVDMDVIAQRLQQTPEIFTVWFRLIFNRVKSEKQKMYGNSNNN